MPTPVIQLSDLKSHVTALLQHTRDVQDTELIQAINYGYGKAIKAILSSRPEAFLAVTPFTITEGVTEYDVSAYDPPIWRPVRLLVGEGGNSPQAFFIYKAFLDQESAEMDVGGASGRWSYFYDFLTGMIAGTASTVVSATTGVVVVNDLGTLAVGSAISIAGAGPAVAIGESTIPGTWRGVVVGIDVGLMQLTVAPAFTVAPTVGAAVTPLSTRLMKLTPQPSAGLSGRLFYNYRPPRLAQDADQLDTLVADHKDLVVWYALAILGRAVGDSNAARWFEDAEAQRSELMQDMDPLSLGGSEHMGSALMGVSDW